MSFKRKGPGVLASGAIGALVGVAIVGSAVLLLSLPASAHAPSPPAAIDSPATFIATQRSN